MSGPWDDYKTEDTDGPWNEYAKVDDVDLKGPAKTFGKNFIGGVDAALSMAAGAVPYIGSGLAGLGTFIGTGGDIDAAESVRNDLNESGLGLGGAKPVTEAGKDAMEMIGAGVDAAKTRVGNEWGPMVGGYDPKLEQFGRTLGEGGLEGVTNFLPLPGGKFVRKLGKAIEGRYAPEVKSEAAKVFEQKATASKGPWEEYEAFKPSEQTPIQADVARLHDQAIVDRLTELNRDKLARAAEAEGVRQADADAAGPIYVDPQEQAFRGNPAEPDPVRGLENQTVAMDTELTHLRGKDTPVGEPLRPLQDVTRTPTEPLESYAPNASRSYAEGPISSAGKRGRQRGAIDVEAIKDAFWKSPMEYLDKWKGAFDERAMNGVRDIIKANKPDVQVSFLSPREFHTVANLRGAAEMADAPRLHDKIRGALDSEKGLFEVPELWVNVKDGVAKVVEHEGRHRMDVFRQKELDKVPTIIRVKETDGSTPKSLQAQWTNNQAATTVFPERIGASAAETNLKNILREDARSHIGRLGAPVNVPLKQRGAVGDLSKKAQDVVKKQNMAKQFSNLGLDEWDALHDPEVAKELAARAPDIGKDFGQKNLVSGINMEVALSNNPLLKLGRTLFRDGRTAADSFSRKFITAKDTGLSAIWPELNTKERIGVMEALYEADKHQQELTPDIMDQLGFNEAQRKFAETFRAADEKLLDMQNKNAEALGTKPTDRRVGHFPGIWTGSYKTVITIPKIRDGKSGIDVAAVVGTDTRAQMKLALDHLKETIPNATMVEQPRGGIGGGKAKHYYSDLVSGWSEVLKLLGRHDERFADVTEIVGKALLDANNRLFNFNVHELAKKGVIGNEGNKPWLSPKENAEQAFKALLRYFEEGAMHHAMQVPLEQVKQVMQDKSTDHMPNARKYLAQYIDKVQGRDANDIGVALNTILDEPFKYIPTISWDKNGNKAVGFGVGAGVPLKMAGALKNNMSQLFMGWFNYMFTGSQLLQPLQTGVPFMQHIASRIGASPVDVATAMGKAGVNFLTAFTESLAGKEVGHLNDTARQAFKYAVDRGLFEFSEIEKAYQGSQGTFSRNKDKLAEINMKFGEQATRTPMFMSFAQLLVDQGMHPDKAFPIAENLTQASMIDYHQWERPMLYSKLGVMGGFAAGLTTFKHGYMSQQTYLAKQGIKPVGGAKRSAAVIPILYSIAAMTALSGITGMPFYSELDALHRFLTNHLTGESKSIRETLLAKNPEWLNSGAISAATGLNLQGKFSSADMIPDNGFRALSPHLEGAAKIGGAAIDAIKNPDAQGVRNLATTVAPSGIRGAVEGALAKDDQGFLIGKDGKRAVYRDPDEWTKRELTGLRPQREAVERESVWDARVKEKADTDRRKQIHQDFERAIVNHTMTPEKSQKMHQEYLQRKGDPTELDALYKKVENERWKTEKQRLEGNPSGLRGYERWKYFNK